MKSKVEGVPDTKKESEKRDIARIVAESSLLPGKRTIFSCFLFSNSGFARPNVLTSVIHIAIAFLVRRTTFQILASTI
jgi:hypothetical protein